jgi:acetyl esterase/lipase
VIEMTLRFLRASAIIVQIGLICTLSPAQPTAPPQSIAVWPGRPPGDEGNVVGPETFWKTRPDGKPIPDVGGKPVEWLTNVSQPALYIHRPPADKDTGTAMIILPGGGLTYLAWDVEGEEVAAWLNGIGVTGIILKYRVPRRPDQMEAKYRSVWPLRPTQDIQRAVSLVRSQAATLGVGPHRIGLIGFSAGAGLAGWATASARTYEPVDAVDQVGCRPDFAVLLYSGGGASPSPDRSHYTVDADMPLNAACPPMFFVAASDDGDKPEIAIAFYLALKQAGVPAELHLYAAGGHNFGLRPTGLPVDTWPQRCEEWLRSLKLLPGK